MKVLLCCAIVLLISIPATAETGSLQVRISWGHVASQASPYAVRLITESPGVEAQDVRPHLLESGEGLQDGAWHTQAGGGDVDGIRFSLLYPSEPVDTIQDLHVLWADLISASDADTARRLARDPAFRPDSPKLTIQMDSDGTRGFTVSVDQLLAEETLWIPSLDVYVAAGDRAVAFAEHLKSLEPLKGKRILDRVRRAPEASYEQYTARWEDMGHPGFTYPEQVGPGHIVGLTWDSAIAKFGIDRAAGVWNDSGNPDHFQFWFAFGDLGRGVADTWKEQRLSDGLPVMTTVFEEDGLRYEVEQFAYPLNGAPAERRGDIPMVLLQKVTVTELRGEARTIPLSMSHRRELPPYLDSTIIVDRQDAAFLFRERGRRSVLFSIEGVSGRPVWSSTHDYQQEQKRIDATLFLDLPARGARDFVVKLPSAVVTADEAAALTAIDYARAREATLQFWSEYVGRGAQFRVPEKTVNDLFRANLWHALRLPRRHGGQEPDAAIDLPYSNFAYSQSGTPWPVNHAVYVDYMLYDLRGYHAISAEELEAQLRNNQEQDGHVSGFANWLVYTPAMLYAVAQNYLLSGDRAAFERLLPSSLKAMDWCLSQIERASGGDGPARGLVRGPLNDGTGDGIWAFNQAYLFAGLDLLGRALQEHGHSRATEALAGARAMHTAIERGFQAASVRSPIVQLRDGTWMPYVPAEALTYGRLLTEWYPTDVDTGAVHLLRLKALAAQGILADSLLNDHEDNLFYKGWGMANEPIYNQQATAYLLRDEPEAAIRAFYSYIASAFSHSVLEPVEHRWTHPQYFGPPSTDGAWFELYRNMLVHERDEGALLFGQATPRAWLQDGQQIEVERAPTYYGPVSMTIESHVEAGEIRADVQMPSRSQPKTLLVRLRHPDGQRMRAVTVNGERWSDFDPQQEWVRVSDPDRPRYAIVARY
ncbi:MAG: hypothetical protein GEU99_03555 [Luteitalea sp.]|nr:hypothetical protein [Luteitalea sp.]